jgi:MurNAc alpha-1-phosphate uridylyltransferase
MVEYVLGNLAQAGVSEALINVHYLPEKMREFVENWNLRGGIPQLQVQDETAEILGSGGAVALGAKWLFENENSALVCNSDVIAKPDLRALVLEHGRLRAAHGVKCTLSLVKHPEAGSKYTGLRVSDGLVTSFERGRADPQLWHFPGFYVVEKSAISRLPAAGKCFSILDELWRPLVAERKLGAWEYMGTYIDLGSVEDLKAAEAALVGDD